jgi:hypothetical protein
VDGIRFQNREIFRKELNNGFSESSVLNSKISCGNLLFLDVFDIPDFEDCSRILEKQKFNLAIRRFAAQIFSSFGFC